MRITYIALTIIFVILIFQSFSNDNTIVFMHLDSSIKRTDSIVHITKHHVQYLDSVQTKNLTEIDSLNQVIEQMSVRRPIVIEKVIHDTIHVPYDID